MKLNIDFSRYAPLGINLGREGRFYVGGMVCAFAYSLSFLTRYGSAHSRLYTWIENKRTIRPGTVMEDFYQLLGSALTGFVIVAMCALVIIIYHYVYHRQGSKSIYLMKRLPNRFELHRRCLTLPILAALISLLAAGVLLLSYYGIYMACTPEECLSPGQWQKLWSVLL